MKINYLFIILFFLLFGCTEEFYIEENKNKKLFVVEGFITNNSEFNTIKLSYSSSTGEPAKTPGTNCEVTIMDNQGNSEILTEIESGTYITSGTEIKGIIGNKYKLEIKTPEGNEYSSDFQEMKEVIEIDSVFAREDKKQIDKYPYLLSGLQFYINTSFAQTKSNYFLWTMTEAYEYDIDKKLEFIETRFGDIIYPPILRYDTIETCWKTENVKYFFTGMTKNLTTSFISEKKLHFVGTKTKKITKRYSVNVNQYIINKDAYSYWQEIENQISNNNLLSTTQIYNIRGNIKNKNNPNEIVLGYFTVASVSKKRIFVNRPRLFFYYDECFVIIGEKAIAEYKKRHSPPYFYVKVSSNEYGITHKECLDCRAKGGDLYKPSFWIP